MSIPKTTWCESTKGGHWPSWRIVSAATKGAEAETDRAERVPPFGWADLVLGVDKAEETRQERAACRPTRNSPTRYLGRE